MKMETFIERINKLSVNSGENIPNIIGSNLVILEFKEFIKRLKEECINLGYYKRDLIFKHLDKLAGEKLI